jgi:hypothetical protein
MDRAAYPADAKLAEADAKPGSGNEAEKCFNKHLCDLAEKQFGQVRRTYVGKATVRCVGRSCYTASRKRDTWVREQEVVRYDIDVYKCNWDVTPWKHVKLGSGKVYQQTGSFADGKIWLSRASTTFHVMITQHYHVTVNRIAQIALAQVKANIHAWNGSS